MAPSITETVTTAVDQTSNGIAKLNLRQDKPTESTKKDVSTEDINLIIVNVTSTQQGPSYPFYFPYYDVNEKFPPTELFGPY
jgi:sulfonate dioxygenase